MICLILLEEKGGKIYFLCFFIVFEEKAMNYFVFIDYVWRGGKDYLCVFVCDWEEGGEDLDENSDESAYWPPQVSPLSWKLEFPMKSQLFLFYCSQSQGVTIVTSCHFYNVAAEVSNLWKTKKIQLGWWYRSSHGMCVLSLVHLNFASHSSSYASLVYTKRSNLSKVAKELKKVFVPQMSKPASQVALRSSC